MSAHEILIYSMAVFAVAGALDRIFGNRIGIGKEFEEGILAMGSLALAMLGIISLAPVLSNLLPRQTSEMCHLYLEGNRQRACEYQLKYIPLIKSLFCEVNPIPVKAAMAAMGFCEDYLRMPLTSMEDEHKAVLLEMMKRAGINF